MGEFSTFMIFLQDKSLVERYARILTFFIIIKLYKTLEIPIPRGHWSDYFQVDQNLGFFEDLSEKDRLFYGKVVLGVFVGIIAGILNRLIPGISAIAFWLLAICALLLLGLLGRNFLKIEEMEPSKMYLTGTVTYFLFFILLWVVVILLSAPETLLPPGSI